jgi:hypothetical protein
MELHLYGSALALDNRGCNSPDMLKPVTIDAFNNGDPCVACPVCMWVFTAEGFREHVSVAHQLCHLMLFGINCQDAVLVLQQYAIRFGFELPDKTYRILAMAAVLLMWEQRDARWLTELWA